MMNLSDRISTFNILGNRLITESEPSVDSYLNSIIEKARHHNPWFTPESVRYAIESIAKTWLQVDVLKSWVNKYPEKYFNPQLIKTIGVIMAGNIPFVGFHDLLCVLINGHRFLGKFSSKDGDLMKSVTKMICEINSEFADYISITDENLHGFDAVIATGSNNASKYFEYYFKNYPSIIRKHRNSLAILNGNESDIELKELGNDIFIYFGLGCRNVSKIFIPVDYDFEKLMKAFNPWQNLIFNNKYSNNYEYHKTIFLMNRVNHYDNGFILVRPDESLGSPVSVLHYQNYKNINEVELYISNHKDEIQGIVASEGLINGSIPFGFSQNLLLIIMQMELILSSF